MRILNVKLMISYIIKVAITLSSILCLAQEEAQNQVHYIPRAGKIKAQIVITNSKSKDDISLLDGAILELGPSKCTLHAGKCVLEGITDRIHIASVLYDPTTTGVDFRFIGVKNGPLIKLKFLKGILVTTSNDDHVTYQFEKIIDPSIIIAGDAADRYKGPTGPLIDMSLPAEIWLKIVDERESKPFVRKSFFELDGVKLRLGDQVCVVSNNECKFKLVSRGSYKISILELPAKLDKNSLKIADESKEVEIVLDEWTKRPKPKNYSGSLRIIIEKTIGAKN